MIPMALVHIFDGIAYNVIDDTLDLLRIRDDDLGRSSR